MKNLCKTIAVVFSIFFFFSCSDDHTSVEQYSNCSLCVKVPSVANRGVNYSGYFSSSDTKSFTVSVNGKGELSSIQVSRIVLPGGTASFNSLLPGTYAITVEAWLRENGTGLKIATGTTEVSILNGENNVDVTLYYQNHPDLVNSIYDTASFISAAQSGGTYYLYSDNVDNIIYIDSTIAVESDLTIIPYGSEIRFCRSEEFDGIMINVVSGGKLNVAGSLSYPVIFDGQNRNASGQIFDVTGTLEAAYVTLCNNKIVSDNIGGSAIMAQTDATVSLVNCRIQENSIRGSGVYGAGIVINKSTVTLENVEFASNQLPDIVSVDRENYFGNDIYIANADATVTLKGNIVNTQSGTVDLKYTLYATASSNKPIRTKISTGCIRIALDQKSGTTLVLQDPIPGTSIISPVSGSTLAEEDFIIYSPVEGAEYTLDNGGFIRNKIVRNSNDLAAAVVTGGTYRLVPESGNTIPLASTITVDGVSVKFIADQDVTFTRGSSVNAEMFIVTNYGSMFVSGTEDYMIVFDGTAYAGSTVTAAMVDVKEGGSVRFNNVKLCNNTVAKTTDNLGYPGCLYIESNSCGELKNCIVTNNAVTGSNSKAPGILIEEGVLDLCDVQFYSNESSAELHGLDVYISDVYCALSLEGMITNPNSGLVSIYAKGFTDDTLFVNKLEFDELGENRIEIELNDGSKYSITASGLIKK